jgi:hypothetical protein
MRIVNVIEVVENRVVGIESFAIFEEQLPDEVVKEAEELFIKKVEEFVGEPLSDEDKERYIEDGYFADETKGYYYVCISWSYVGE